MILKHQMKIHGYLELINTFLADYFSRYENNERSDLIKSMQYSILGGGKRFRPILALATAELLGRPITYFVSYAVGVELIHTYSLIHDDLPCMDNDDVRRGKPSNHKQFGEATALLAGDALLTEAFHVVSAHTKATPINILKAIETLTKAAGMQGMVSGQALDILNLKIELNDLIELHKKKTGALISAAVIGMAQLCDAFDSTIDDLRKFAENLGLAFQVKDDLLDDGEDKTSFVNFMGEEETKKYLITLTENSRDALSAYGKRAEFLIDMTEYNLERTQ